MNAFQLATHFQGLFRLTNEQVQELAGAINFYFQQKEPDYSFYDEDDDEPDFEDWALMEEEEIEEREAMYAATCTCGAWQFGKNGPVHIADCCCGAE
jgi:hypothetical protein